MNSAESAPGHKTHEINVVSDVMCPWCYIGKRRLERALQARRDVPVIVQWQPFQLDATLPAEGKDRQQYLSEKFGAGNAARFYERIRQEGEAEGLPFDFDAIAVSPNTRDAHRMISWAGDISPAAQDALVETLFAAFFTKGRNIGRHDELVEAWAASGLEPDGMADRLAGDERGDYVDAMVAAAHNAGISGVPCFIFDQRFAVSGAQAADILIKAIDEMVKAEPATTA